MQAHVLVVMRRHRVPMTVNEIHVCWREPMGALERDGYRPAVSTVRDHVGALERKGLVVGKLRGLGARAATEYSVVANAG